jgi:hypothetical protein
VVAALFTLLTVLAYLHRHGRRRRRRRVRRMVLDRRRVLRSRSKSSSWASARALIMDVHPLGRSAGALARLVGACPWR